MTSTDHDTGLAPGSLAARILDHMRVAGGEFEAGELAEALRVDLSEVRAAAGTLRKLAKVLVRVEDGHPLYKLPEHSGSRIPGSAAQVIGERRRASTPPVETPLQQPTEAPMPKTPTKATVTIDLVLAAVRETPGLTCQGIANRLGNVELAGRVSTALSKLAAKGLVQRANAKRPYCFRAIDAPSEKPAKAATAPKASPKPERKPNLAAYGATARPPASAGLVAFAIDHAGTVAIGAERLPRDEVQRLVDFLTKAQHLWQRAQA